MARRHWTLNQPDGLHTVELEHGWGSGKRKITVDGRVVEQTSNVEHLLFDTGSEHHIAVGSQSYVIRIRNNWFTLGFLFIYELERTDRPPGVEPPPFSNRPPLPEP